MVDKLTILKYSIHLFFLTRLRRSGNFSNNITTPPIFVQGKHVLEIDKVTNKNDLRTHLYGLKM